MLNPIVRHLCKLALIAFPLAALAIEPGEYTTEKSWGTLVVKRDKSGKVNFTIESVGDNAHGCTLEGEIKNGKATLDVDDPKQPCVVKFTQGKEGIEVSGGPGMACQYYCGMRASFDGVYMKASPACRPDGVDNTRAAARKAYDRKAYDEAKTLLTGVLKDCKRFLGQLSDGRVRNDLAITLHKLKDFAGCREALKPLAEDAAMTDAKIREDYAPTDADMYLPIVKATRVNLKLCAQGKS
jgi:hypothetical protein